MALVHITIGSEQKAEIERKLKLHQTKIKEARTVVDTNIPSSLILAPKQKRVNTMEKERIAKENFHLAQRLFHIMGKPSEMSTAIHQQPQFNPHTLNFKVRLEEAQKINMVNQKIAEKLDAVKPTSYLHHGGGGGGGVNNMSNDGKTKLPFIQRILLHGEKTSPLISVPGHTRPRTLDLQHLSAATDSSIERLRTKIVDKLQGRTLHNDVSAPPSSTSSPMIMKNKSPIKPRKPKIILECTKEQGEYMIDTVIMKEPFRDRFAIFGIDVITGKRFELFIPSEAVFNILEGEMLVTSVEKKSVWRAVLPRVTLNEVERFSKIKVAKVAMSMYPSLGPSNSNPINNHHHRTAETATAETTITATAAQGMKEKGKETFEEPMREDGQVIELKEVETTLTSHNNNNNNNNEEDISHNNNYNDDDGDGYDDSNHHHMTTHASALRNVDDLKVWEVHDDDDDDDLIDMHDGPLYDANDPEMMEIITTMQQRQQREPSTTIHGKTAKSMQTIATYNDDHVSSSLRTNKDNAVGSTTLPTTTATTTTTKASAVVDIVDVLDVIENNENYVITSQQRRPHPPTSSSVPSVPAAADLQPQAPTISSVIPSGKRGGRGNICQVHAMARLSAVPTAKNSKTKPTSAAAAGVQPKQPQPQQQQQTPSQLKPQPPPSSKLPSSSKGMLITRPSQRPRIIIQPPHVQQQRPRSSYVVMVEESASGVRAEVEGEGGGGGVGVGIDVVPADSYDVPSSTSADHPICAEIEHSKESSIQPSIEPILSMMVATETSINEMKSQIVTTDVDTNNGCLQRNVTTKPATTTQLSSSDSIIHVPHVPDVPNWDETFLHKRKGVLVVKHTMKTKAMDTSAVVQTTTTTTAVTATATSKTAVTATAKTARVGKVKQSLYKPQPPTKPKSHEGREGRISTLSRPQPISITVTTVPPSNISPLSSPSALPSSSPPKKSSSQNVLPGEERRLQLEKRLKLIKREAALRRSQQQTQTIQTTQPPSSLQQQSPQPDLRPNEEDNGAEYYTQLSSNEMVQEAPAPADGDESVETITMSVC